MLPGFYRYYADPVQPLTIAPEKIDGQYHEVVYCTGTDELSGIYFSK